MYRLDYQYTHDIDWFCKINDIPVHLASNGGNLPHRSYTIKKLVALQHRVANMQQSFRCVVNVAFLEEYLQRGEYYDELVNVSQEDLRTMLPERFELTDEVSGLSRTMLLYSWSFIEMAKRGFCSFDRREEDGLYHLVAWPDGYDGQQFDKEVYGSLVEYRACCFPPFHEDYGTNMPDCVRFDVESISYFYDKK